MAKKRMKKRIVTKDVGQAVNATFSADTSPTPQVNVVPTPATGSNSSVMYWPSPQAFYQQGKEMAKKAFHEYLNALNQYQNVPDDQFDQKMQLAGKMNNMAQSFVQGIAIGTESAENIFKRVRTGDQAALIEMEAVKDVLSKMLKTLWVHNKAAASGKWPGLEAKLLESPMVTRINQSTQLASTNYGIAVSAPEEADTIWVDAEMPSPMEMMQGQTPAMGDLPVEEEQAVGEQPTGEEEVPIEEMFPEEGVEGEAPSEEGVAPEGEMVPESEAPTEEEEIPVNFEEGSTEPTEEVPVEDTGEITNEEPIAETTEESVPEEPVAEEEPTEEKEPIATEEPVVEEPIEEETEEETEEVPEDGEEFEDVDEDGIPMPTGPNGYYTREDMIKYGQMVADDILEGEEYEESEEEPINEGEEEGVESEEVQEGDEAPEEEIDGEEEETFYCVECDKEVSASDVEECDNPNCPFKKDLGNLEGEEEEIPEDEIPVDFEEEEVPEDEIPVDFEEEEEQPEEEVPVEEEEENKQEKHFIMMDHDDHSGHNVKNITIKEFTDVDGDYCLDCGKILSYSFAQKSWTSDDAKRWVSKQLKINKQKNMSSKEIIVKTLDKFPEEILNEWVEDKKKEHTIVDKSFTHKTDDVEISIDELKEVFNGNSLKDVLERAFEPLSKRLKSLEA